jgi:hypothetical protein
MEAIKHDEVYLSRNARIKIKSNWKEEKVTWRYR